MELFRTYLETGYCRNRVCRLEFGCLEVYKMCRLHLAAVCRLHKRSIPYGTGTAQLAALMLTFQAAHYIHYRA